MTQPPSIGRIVHYQSYGTPGGEYLPEPRAAIITEVHDYKVTRTLPTNVGESGTVTMTSRVGLCVLNPTGQFFNRDVPYADTPTPGHWNWPPRVDA